MATVSLATIRRETEEAHLLRELGELAASVEQVRNFLALAWTANLPTPRIRDMTPEGAYLVLSAGCSNANELTACARALAHGARIGDVTKGRPNHAVTVTRRFGMVLLEAWANERHITDRQGVA